MSPKKLCFHFDFISPYAYLAWTQIHRVAEQHGVIVEPVPTLLAGLLNHHQTVGPAEVPAKRVYVFKDTLRRAALLGVPLSPPPRHPFNPLLALRLCAATEGEAQRALIDALYDATWGDAPEQGVDDPDVVRAIVDRLGLPSDALFDKANRPETKEKLKQLTAEAIAQGVFGVPTMRVGEGPATELFFGLDSFDLLALHLSGKDPLPKNLLETFTDVPVGATRRR